MKWGIRMFFRPFIFRGENGTKIPVKIIPATETDILNTYKSPAWQSDWGSEYLTAPEINIYALKTTQDELVALGAYQVFDRYAYVYILYLESSPHSNPTMALNHKRKYYGIGEVMIAFGIKFSIDHGCRGDVVFDAKTDALADHYEKDFRALQIPRGSADGPKRFMLADEDAWRLFSKYLSEEDPL